MKSITLKLTISLLSLLIAGAAFSQGVVISGYANATPHGSAMLDVQTTEKGFLPPRMATSERNDIISPANGLVVYDTNEESLFLFNGTEWEPLVTGSGSRWEADGNNIFRNTGNVGIGTANPQYPLHLMGDVGVSWQVERNGGSLLRGTANINDASVGTHNPTAFRLLTNNTVRLHVAPNGNIGIGSVNPSARLHLVGDLRIQDGTHGAGKVLTSDALGNATWSEVDVYGSSTIVVDASGSGNFLTISAALNSVTPTADNPVTILIKSGTYFEEVVLKSHVRLVGEDENNVLITGWAGGTPGFGGYPYGVLLNLVTNVHISNLTIESNSLSDPYLDYGVLMIDSEARFENVNILGDYDLSLMVHNGIKAENSELIFIDGRIQEVQNRAIQLVNTTAEVSKAKLSASLIHVEVENGSQLELTNSQMTGYGDGVSVLAGGTANLLGNRFENNWVGVRNHGRLLMNGNYVRNTAFRGVLNHSNAIITGNYFVDCIYQAIFDQSTGKSTITGNHIENSSFGGEPAMSIFSEAVVSSNFFHNNTHGDIIVGSIKPWLIGNRGNMSGNPIRGIMAGIGDMRIEREGADMLFNLPVDGKVGIGTLSPRGRFNISVNSGVTDESTIDEYPLMISYPSNTAGEETGIAFRISGEQHPTQTPGAAITHLRTGSGSSGDLLFKTKPGNFNPTIERVRITGNGNVGIGTDSPGALLHVERTSSSSIPQARIHNSSATGFARLRLTNEAHEHYWDIASGGTNNYLDFYHNGNGGSMMTLRPDLQFVGVRTINPAFTLHVNGDAGKPGGGSWANASDARLKSDVQDLHGSLENLLKLRGVTFIYTDPETIYELPGKRTGMIAQEVAEVFPDWVSEASDGYLRLTYRGFEALMVEALRELRAEKDAEIESLNSRLTILEALMNLPAANTRVFD